MGQQQTLRGPASFSGVGLHSGQPVTLRFVPAPPNHGIRFRRVDLEGQPEVEASVANLAETQRSTSLSKGSVKIHTVEHVLSTLAGLGVDNLTVELDANEPPIGDGSAEAFSRMVQEAGLEPQGVAARPFKLAAPVHLQAGESVLSAFPDDCLRVTCTSADKEARFTQFFSLEISPQTWERELARARTFCFFDEIEYLIKNGLIRGGSLENAVVIRDDAILTTEPLRYPEEFVRHKILDLIGDLALVGCPLRGHFIAVKPSHAANCELARRISEMMRQFESDPAAAPLLKEAPPAQAVEDVPLASGDSDAISLDAAEVMKILPHRYPFLLVDRVMALKGNKIRAVKNVTMNEPYFQGHFPGHPIMPGVLQLEAIAQTAGMLMLRQAEDLGRVAYFMSAEKVKWRKPVRPGDQLVIDVELVKFRGKIARARGACSVRGEVVSEAEVTVMLTER